MFENLLKEIKNKKNVFEFYKLEEEEIKDAEERLGYSFPPILRSVMQNGKVCKDIR